MDKGKSEGIDPGEDLDNVGPGGGAAVVVVLVIIITDLQEDNGKQGETELKGGETKAGKVNAQAGGALCLILCLNLVDGWRICDGRARFDGIGYWSVVDLIFVILVIVV